MATSGFDEKPGQGQTVVSTHRLRREQKGMQQNVQTVENRIRFFRREEQKIWRDIEEARRQASKIEEARTRVAEKRLSDQSITLVKEQNKALNRVRASKQKAEVIQGRKDTTAEIMSSRRSSGQALRRESQANEERVKLAGQQLQVSKSERVVSMQQRSLEAKLRAQQDRAERLARIRESQELARLEAERDVQDVESRLPELEQQEIACIQKLQDSRYMTQSVLQELESSLGAHSSVATMLRAKQLRSIVPLEPPLEAREVQAFTPARPTRVSVLIHSAKGLRNADSGVFGKSDPYCICEIVGKKPARFQTKVIKNNLNPVWEHHVEVDLAAEDRVVFTVYDEDPIKSDDLLGKATLLAADVLGGNGFSGEVALEDAGEGIVATLRVEIGII